MSQERRYSTRSSAVRAARAACRKALNAPHYLAYEGPDYEIHPDGGTWELGWEERYFYRLRGPAKDEDELVK